MSRSLYALLIAIGFLDELAGVGFVATADIEHDLQISHARVALAMFTVPGLIAMVVEPPLLLLADARGPRAAMGLGLLAMGLGLAGCAFVGGWPLLAALSTVYFVGSGVGVVLAKTALVDAHPDRRAQVMARWTLAGALGDIAAPLLLAGLAAVALGWRSAYLAVGGTLVLVALGLALGGVRTRVEEEDDDGGPGTLAALREALKNRRMLAWLFAAASCDLLDEVFVAFAGLYLFSRFHPTTEARSLVLAGFMTGGVLGVIALERLLARGAPARRILQLTSLFAALCFLGWMAAPGLALSAVALAGVGFFAAQLWPLTEAEAYDSFPGSARIVQAVSGIFAPLAQIVPFLVGWIADRWGLGTALCVLLLQPVLVFVVASTTPSGDA